MTTKKTDAKSMDKYAYEFGREMGVVLADMVRAGGAEKPALSEKQARVPKNPFLALMKRGFVAGYNEK